jgi:hypothetical protein
VLLFLLFELSVQGLPSSGGAVQERIFWRLSDTRE